MDTAIRIKSTLHRREKQSRTRPDDHIVINRPFKRYRRPIQFCL